MSWCWCDGDWHEDGLAQISLHDRGWMHGLGLFETLLSVDGRPAFLGRHLARLGRSCEAFGWNVDVSGAVAAIPELLEKNRLGTGRARIRLALSGGTGPLDAPDEAGNQRLWLTAAPLGQVPELLKVGISQWKRNHLSPLVGQKCSSYSENLFLLAESREQGWDEVLVFNHDGWLCEAAMANAFVVTDDGLVTPALCSGCLPGVTRGVLLELAAALGIPSQEGQLGKEDLRKASAAFLSSSTRGPVLIGVLDGRRLSEPPWFSDLRQAWAQAVLSGE